MARNRVGDAALRYMAQDGTWNVCVLDGAMNDLTWDLEPPLTLWKGMNPHPLNRARVAASYLARDDRFEVGRIRAHDSNGHERVLRLFTAKPEFRAYPAEMNLSGAQRSELSRSAQDEPIPSHTPEGGA
jgi:hypothetical protein